jgi:hypothetical protein
MALTPNGGLKESVINIGTKFKKNRYKLLIELDDQLISFYRKIDLGKGGL